MHNHDPSPSNEHADKPRLIGQLIHDEPVEVVLQPGERLDIFTGNSAGLEKAEADDPRRFSVIDLQAAERNERGAIIYDGQELNPNLAYLITQPNTPIDWQGGAGYKGVRRGEVVDMGRAQDAVRDRFNFPDTVSRRHFTVAVDDEGKLMLEDTGSSNGTSFQTTKETAVTEAIALSPEEKQKQAHLRKLFSLPDPQGRDRFGNDQDRRLAVTEQSQADAALAYRYTDADVKDILSTHARQHYDDVWRENDMAKMLREDVELRTQLGAYLLEKLDHEEIRNYLPYRFYRPDDIKNPNYAGYQRMTSQEYAAVLAISMLDGTFKAPTSDPIESEYGDIIRGQHRYAAMMLLGIQKSPLAKIKQIR